MQLWVRSMQSVFFFVVDPLRASRILLSTSAWAKRNNTHFQSPWIIVTLKSPGKIWSWTHMLWKNLILFFGPKKPGEKNQVTRASRCHYNQMDRAPERDGFRWIKTCASWCDFPEMVLPISEACWLLLYLDYTCTGKKNDIFWEILLELREKHPSFYPFIPRNLTGFQSFHPPSPKHKLGFA